MENLKLLRKNAGKTQQEMADILKTTYRTYQNYESDVTEMPYASLIVAADYFGCSIDYLLGHQSSNIVHLDSFTAEQKDLIDTILQLSAEGCGRVQAYAEGLLTAEEEKAATIRKFRR